jgi:hypothetical protein
VSIFASLAGRWALTRTFSPDLGRMSGTATFTPVGTDELLYREDGTLELTGGYRGSAWREYRYLRDDESTIRIVLTDTGVTMHTLRVPGGAAEALVEAGDVHLCGADTYQGRYRFALPGGFEVDMTVSGPRKDYRTHTVYRRAG